jgi:tetratricopeptide (TPR) repeat protein
MPRNGAENIPHVAWTDHRIRKMPELGEAVEDIGEGDTLIPIFSPGVTKRDLALAYYSAVLDGNVALQNKAYQPLEEMKSEISDDTEALAALGVLSETRGDYKQAEDVLEQVQKLDSKNLIALLNLGVLRAKSGELQSAMALLQPAFEHNEDLAGLAKNVAEIQCTMGDAAAARMTLQKTLQYNPGLSDVEQMLARLSTCPAAKP